MYLEKLRLDGKTALVMGAGRGGMGTQTSLALAEAGASVFAVDRTSELVEETAALVRDVGGTCVGTAFADLRHMDQAKKAVVSAIDQVGEIHLLVNVAGGMRMEHYLRFEDTTDLAYEEQMNLNLNYVFVTCREVGRHMIAHGIKGSIVNYGSISANAASPYHGPYGAAKAGVIALTKTMAVEWGKYGIRVNAVVPGSAFAVRPRGGDEEATKEYFRYVQDWTPLQAGQTGPMGADAVPAAVLFLLSDLAAMITGEAITVDAGMTARHPMASAEWFERYLDRGDKD